MPILLRQVSLLVNSVLKIAARVEAPTYRDLYESALAHPNLARSKGPVLIG
jgi:hypothetical protein